jgi:hypothetical protein
MPHFVDILAAALVGDATEDFLIFLDGTSRPAEVLGARIERSHARAMIVPTCGFDGRQFAMTLRADYQFALQRDMRAYARVAYDSLLQSKSGLEWPTDFPLLNGESHQDYLTIRACESWPLVLPFDHFVRYPGYAPFSRYGGVEWLVTEKLFFQNTVERMEMKDKLDDATYLLSHCAFILNDYAKFHRSPGSHVDLAATAGFKLVRELLTLLNEIDVDGTDGPLSARWFANPNRDTVLKILADQSIDVLFANFHVEDGAWQEADVVHGDAPVAIGLSGFAPGSLAHIKQLQAYHCNSLGDCLADDEEQSICQTLSRAGVKRVSGSPMQEDVRHFICTILNVLCNRRGLCPFLVGACLGVGQEWATVSNRVNGYLNEHGYPPI